MAALPSELTSLDFFEIKESIRSYLRTRKEFTDYDFEGSAASYLIDILAYNTYYASFTANMSMNEAFLESATVRDNIVRIAKQVGYTPRSKKGSRACITMTAKATLLPGDQAYPTSVEIKKGDAFVAKVGGEAFIFSLLSDVQATVDQSTGLASFTKMLVYQGNLLTYSFLVDDTKKSEYVIPSEDVDTERMKVFVRPNEQSVEVDEYSLARNVTTLTSTSRNYFLEETDDLRYKITFGDGVLGRELIDNEYITVEYLDTDGQVANGAKKFGFIGRAIDSTARPILPQAITLSTVETSADGEPRETALTIKYRAPKSFSVQNRAVTENDYAYLVSELYPQAASVTAYGGEKLNPPEYGKVYVAVRTKSGVNLNNTTKRRIKNQLLDYSMASIQPEIVDPTIFYLSPTIHLAFNGNNTTRSSNELAAAVLKSVDRFNSQERDNRFGGRIEPSKFNAMVDSSDSAITGTTTQMVMAQNLDKFTFGNQFSQCLDFSNPITNPNDYGGGGGGDGGGTPCSTSADCPPGQICVNGTCQDDSGTPCSTTADCPAGQICINGTCQPDPGAGGGGGGNDSCKPKFSSVKSGTFYATGYTEEVADLIAAGQAAGSLINGTTISNPVGGGSTTLEDVVVNATTATTQTLVPVNIRDDGLGNLMMVTNRNEKEVILNDVVGTVDYERGVVCVGPINIGDSSDGTTRIPVVVLPKTGPITIPPGVDPTIFNPSVFPRDINTNPGAVASFDPFSFNGWNYGGSNINTITYPTGTFSYPELDSCF
jgi:hypothetical protein